MRRIAILAALVLAACSGESGAPTDPAAPASGGAGGVSTEPSLTSQGWGPIKVGMTEAEVIAAAGPDANPDAVGGPDEEACKEFHPANTPEGLFVMIETGKVSRISIAELSPVKDAKGLGLGDTAAKIKEAHGASAQASPHKYQDAPAEYITVWDGGPLSDTFVQDEAARGIVYEIDGTGKVGAIHVGGPSIQYVEGCA